MKIVVVSPHRDDAAFSLGLAVSAWLAAGHSVEVLNCFTRSEYAPFSDADSLHSNDRMSFVTALRGREDECWRKLCGNKLSLTDLHLKDAPIRFHCSLQELAGQAIRPEEKAFLKIQTAVRTCTNPLVLPLGLGGDVDHLTAREAALSVIGSSTPCAFYEDWPGSSAPEALSAENTAVELAQRLSCDLRPVYVGPKTEPAAAVARKRTLALCYDSQVDTDEVTRIAEACIRYGGRERLWANELWRLKTGGVEE